MAKLKEIFKIATLGMLAVILSMLFLVGIAHSSCYQPAADYTICGGCSNITENASGTYTCWNDFNPSYPCANGYDIIGSCGGGAATDSAWGTIAANTGSNTVPSGILVEWIKPNELKGNFNSSPQYVINDDSGTIAPYNVSIPLSCWQKFPDKIWVNISTLWYIPSPPHGSDHYCYNTSNQWQLMGFTDYRYYFITGSAIWWNETLPPPCESIFTCTKFSVCDNFKKQCLTTIDTACGRLSNATVLASFEKNCSINAQSEDVGLQSLDLRYESNVLLLLVMIVAYIGVMAIAFAFHNPAFGFLGFLIGVGIGLIFMQVSPYLTIGFILLNILVFYNTSRGR